MASLPKESLSIIQYLQDNSIVPILYGSQGVSLYLGSFKKFGDVDLLVEERYLHEDWGALCELMNKADYKLIDLHEHEFRNDEGTRVAFASEQILIRDEMVDSIDETANLEVDGTYVKTLTPSQFIKAYEFSIKDGYRKNVRSKNDAAIIELLNAYIQ